MRASTKNGERRKEWRVTMLANVVYEGKSWIDASAWAATYVGYKGKGLKIESRYAAIPATEWKREE